MSYIHVRVTAGAKKESFVQTSKDHFRAAVREKAERNMANNRITELVAHHFDVSKSMVRIVNGHQSPSKLLTVKGVIET